MTEKLTNEEIKDLQGVCRKIRRNIVEMIYNAKSGHPGGSLSSAEILTVLYSKIMRHFPDWDKNPEFKNRDRFILSKGHASALIYAILAHFGYFPAEELKGYRKFGSKLQGHPSSKLVKGIEISTGSLGQGLSVACGTALGLRLDGNDARVYVLMGDGELQEGSVWEAAMNAAHYKLNNIIAVVDRNKLQIDGCTETVMSLGDVAQKFKAFGWNTEEVDGHDVEKLFEAFKAAQKSDKPTVIVADTIKGKGVSFMENQAGWHGKVPSEEQYLQAMQELSEGV